MLNYFRHVIGHIRRSYDVVYNSMYRIEYKKDIRKTRHYISNVSTYD